MSTLENQANSSSFLSNENDMRVTKRNGAIEIVSFDKILKRIKTIGHEANIKINYTSLVMKVIDQLFDKISTTKIDELSAEQCASMASVHPEYNTLAGRIIVSNHHKNTQNSFCDAMSQLYNYRDKHDKQSPLISHELYEITQKYSTKLDELCDYSRDYLIDYFGFKTLERAYLMKINKKTIERPQHMWLRVAIGIHGDNLEKIKQTYDLMSQKYFTHATPTLFNAGTPRPQCSSCFLLALENDSIEGIYDTLKDCALISKWSGGIGLHIHNVRASGSHIRGTNGTSNGIVPMLRVFNNTARYVDQCVHPETVIYTTNGPKLIQNCSTNETSIFNLNGEKEVIQNVLEHFYKGELLEINTAHSIHPLRITPEHPICVLRENHLEKNGENILDYLKYRMVDFEWIDAKDLHENDRIVYTIPKDSEDIGSIYNEDCYMYGIILKNGYINNDETNEYIVVDITDKPNLKDFILNYFHKRCIEYITIEDSSTSRILWNKSIQLPFTYNDFYDEHKNIRIHHKWLNLPIEKCKYILKGLLDTHFYNENEIIFDNNSILFIESIRFICLKMGILTTGQIKKDIDNNVVGYILYIPKTNDICDLMGIEIYNNNNVPSFLKYENYLLSPIQKINSTTYTGTLYDLQMKHQHNYMLDNGIVHNGGGKRNGSFAIYLEPWHADIELFLQMRKNHGDEELKARDLFYALWMPDLFMERVKSGGKWTLFCPDECPGLSDVYGEEFATLYNKYEESGKGRKTMNARDLWFQILDSQMETGTPYIVYKDAANKKSNQKNIGTIKSSNLCSEIIQYSDSTESSVCNLASIALPSFIDKSVEPPIFDYNKLHEITRVVTYNLNRIIDVNFYPTAKTEKSNKRHRPIGIGVQGLADVFMLMDLSFTSDEAKQLNRNIFETIYHASLTESCNIAIRDGPYETFEGSPMSKGLFQFDLWGLSVGNDRYNWDELREQIMKYGIRNSLLVAPMPTASTSQILGYNECIEPITSNIYSRRTIAGEFIMANKYLMNDLIKLNLWNEKIKNNIIANNGSIQQIELIPEKIRNKYRTVWELQMKHLIDMAADRGAFICQSQSLNLWLEDPNYNTLTSMHFYGWSKGLKTGIYYLRRRGAHKCQQFTIEPEKKMDAQKQVQEEDEICEMCSA